MSSSSSSGSKAPGSAQQPIPLRTAGKKNRVTQPPEPPETTTTTPGLYTSYRKSKSKGV